MKSILALRSQDSDQWLTYDSNWNVTADPSKAAIFANAATAESFTDNVYRWCASRNMHYNKCDPPKVVAFVGRPVDSWDDFLPFVRMVLSKLDDRHADVQILRQASGLRFGHEHVL